MSGASVGAFLPGELVVGRGEAGDYRALERFHYLAGSPATWAGVWVVRYVERTAVGRAWRNEGTARNRKRRSVPDGAVTEIGEGRVVGVAVLSWPAVNSRMRDAVLGLTDWEWGRRLRFVNGDVRTISRVVVHPQFRGVGVASGLVRRVCEECPTRWVEAFAVMGRVNPFFARAGMREFGREGEGRPVYYLKDKGAGDERNTCTFGATANW